MINLAITEILQPFKKYVKLLSREKSITYKLWLSSNFHKDLKITQDVFH